MGSAKLRTPSELPSAHRLADLEFCITCARREARQKVPPKQYPTLEGIKNILEPLAITDPKAKTAKAEDFAEMRFVRELDESGFIDDLYKGRDALARREAHLGLRGSKKRSAESLLRSGQFF